ncbi:hypothetical protein OZX61_12080 (plasmid) [Acinetobacter sp. ESL0695]|uniref:hypothetical protein n=2 Tax=Acinetobacter sp. ESL0695 TaxID=2983215 RepID=UPI0023F12BAD|nr:hypothetical protein [Acinetobacter sp. ESL0695]WEV50095.1 hypothetical protein OZX61_12080 [Acinetobacter sp. ESL0695]
MSLVEIFDELQWKQKQHDKRYHEDIWILSVQNRAKHMILHLNKYSGKFFESLRENNLEKLEGHVIDAMIINFSYANIFQVPISRNYEKKININDLNQLINSFKTTNNKHILDMVIDFAISVGKMSKTIESLDHVEQHNYRENLNQYVFDIQDTLFSVCAYLTLSDIEKKIEKRLYSVESKNMSFKRLGNYSSGYL